MDSSRNKKVEESITRLMRKVDTTKVWLVTHLGRYGTRVNSKPNSWPMLPGAYMLGDPRGQVAVCTLTSNELFAPLAKLPGVAIAGRMYSANLGIEKMIANVTANPSIRFLLICGKESTYFQAGQALCALMANGVSSNGHIVQATGHMPELSHMDQGTIDRFRQQVKLVNHVGETDPEKLGATIQELFAQRVDPYQDTPLQKKAISLSSKQADGFQPIRLGGHRESLAYDPKGFFIISLDRRVSEIVVHHYLPDNSPAHVVRGRNGEAILLALLREELISQKSHAGYLGAELAKAETALRLDLQYDQDRPLRLHQEIPQ
ncbi:MAG TPA: hypothetical protein VK897_08520 [Anaerolineales bacterium]|nr:hypothetical protein [Anaerolineales bacterium]